MNNRFIKTLFKKSLLTILASTMIVTGFSSNLLAKSVYTYRDKNGNVLITDRPYKKKDFKLEKRVHIKPFRDRSPNSRSNHQYFAKARQSQYDVMINNLALSYDLEPAFIKAVVHVESAFNPQAVSHAGAMGLMQLMPGTAKLYNLQPNQFNPESNLVAGIRHMHMLMNRYGEDKKLSLAAYNAGEGAVSKYNGIPPYPETVDYVAKVMKLYNKYLISFTG